MSRKGFTLIEMMIVTVILGMLALIAVPKVQQMKVRGYVAKMQSELRNFRTAQEMYYVDDLRYATTVADLTEFQVSDGTTFTFTSADNGWSVVAEHINTTRTCALFIGPGNEVPPATEESVTACDP